MIQHAPAWARKRRDVLMPLVAAIGGACFAALMFLPPLDQAIAAYSAVAIVGVLSWAGLVLLANGEPVPSLEFREADVSDGAVEFVVRHGIEETARARREFWWRSARELRFGTQFLSPAGMIFFAAFAYKTDGASIATNLFAALAALTIVMAATFPLLVGRAGAEHARRFPEQRVLVSPAGIAVGAGTPGLAWSSFWRRWESPETITLVMSPFMAVQLPKRDVPEAARRIMAEQVPGGRSEGDA